jgi:RNA polymerase sigma-70 factor (ECF subfamily)
VPAFIEQSEDQHPAAVRASVCGAPSDSDQAHVLNPRALVAHRAVLYRVARALCHSHHEAEDLVQETFARVLARPRVLRPGNDLSYLVRALRNTYSTGRRVAARRPVMMPMPSEHPVAALDVPATVEARGVMAAIAAAPRAYRDAVVAVDVLGLSYEQAAHRLRTSKATINTRVFRGRAHVARILDAGVSG